MQSAKKIVGVSVTFCGFRYGLSVRHVAGSKRKVQFNYPAMDWRKLAEIIGWLHKKGRIRYPLLKSNRYVRV